MKILFPASVEGLEQMSPLVWTNTCSDPALVLTVAPGQTGFIGFFLSAGRGAVAPRLTFDKGEGFDAATAVSLDTFPFGFYHVSIDKITALERIRVRPCSEPATFRFLPFETKSAVLVAVLHYVFNLRYRKITLMTADRKGRIGGLAWIKGNVSRIVKFFRDIERGEGARIVESEADAVAKLQRDLAPEVARIRIGMDALLKERTSPLLSFICPTYNTPLAYLADLLQSFKAEGAAYAELILSDDGSTDPETRAALMDARDQQNVKVVFNQPNEGIASATNAGLRSARGEWVAFIDHDDLFASGAVAVIAQAIQNRPEADFFYTDEIIVDAALRTLGTFCKPAFDSVLLSGMNYINHFSIFRRERVETLGGLRTDREGSQDYDLLLRYLVDRKPGSAVHIPFFAYRWRRDEQTYSALNIKRAVDNARQALLASIHKGGRDGTVMPAIDPHLHKVRFAMPHLPLVSIVIPSKNSFDLISRILVDLEKRTSYSKIEIVVVDNGSDDPAVLTFYDTVRCDGRIAVDIVHEAFNFAAMCNRGARRARGEVLLFLNNDIEVLDADWLEEMVACLAFPATGIVGAKLLYPNGLVQHNGVIVGLGGAAGHWYIEAAATEPGPMSRFAVRQTLSAVTGACMLVTRACFDALGGFDAEAFAIAYNDIDFCLRAKAAGFRTVWTPFAQLRHHESASRGSDEDDRNKPRFLEEMDRLKARHGTVAYVDDAYHPAYDRQFSKPRLHTLTELPPTRPSVFP